MTDPLARHATQAELETAACIIAARLGITPAQARTVAARITRPARPAFTTLPWLARTMTDSELLALRDEGT